MITVNIIYAEAYFCQVCVYVCGGMVVCVC